MRLTYLGVLVVGILTFCGTIVFVGALLSLPLYLLWNWLMPVIFGVHEITWLQAWGVMVLSGILFSKKNITKKV